MLSLTNQTLLPRMIIIYRYIKVLNLGHRKVSIDYFITVTRKYLQNIIIKIDIVIVYVFFPFW